MSAPKANGRAVPLCKNCQHFVGLVGYFPASRCIRPFKTELSLVEGSIAIHLDVEAETERRGRVTLFSRRSKCGPEGVFYAQRQASPPPPQRGK